MNIRENRKETSRSLDAYQRYLALPLPRDYKELVGEEPRGGGKPYTFHTLREWAYVHRWAERALKHDAEVAQAREEALKKFRISEHERRMKQRMQAAEVQRNQALKYLIDEETKAPKPLQRLSPRLAEIAGMFIKQAGDAERLDLIDAVEESKPQNAEVHVLTADGINQLKELFTSVHIRTPAERMLSDVIDVEVVGVGNTNDESGGPADPGPPEGS